MRKTYIQNIDNKGISLLVAVLVTSIALIMTLAISRIVLKELALSQASRDSQAAFYAANSGIECALFEDLRHSVFSPSEAEGGGGGLGGSVTIACNGQTKIINFEEIQPVDDPDCTGDTGYVKCWEFTMSENEILLDEEDQSGPCFSIRAVKEEFFTEEDGTFFTTAVESRGYNNCIVGNPRRVERAIRVTY